MCVCCVSIPSWDGPPWPSVETGSLSLLSVWSKSTVKWIGFYIYTSLRFFFLSFFIAAWAHLDLLRSSSSFHLVSPPSSQLSSLTFWIWTRSFVEQAHNSWFIRVEERVERGVKVRMSCLARGCYNTEPIATRYYIINTNYKWLDRKLPGERLNSMLFNTIRTETSWLHSAASVLNNVYYVQTL